MRVWFVDVIGGCEGVVGVVLIWRCGGGWMIGWWAVDVVVVMSVVAVVRAEV